MRQCHNKRINGTQVETYCQLSGGIVDGVSRVNENNSSMYSKVVGYVKYIVHTLQILNIYQAKHTQVPYRAL